MEKSEKILNKVLNSLSRMPEENERIAYMLYYLNHLLKTKETLFLTKEQIPERGLTHDAWTDKEVFFINDLSQEERYDTRYDQYGEDICALLFYPVREGEEYLGLLVSSGKDAHSKEEEQMTPLKSGEQTIGVTVKQTTIEVPAHHFSSEDIALLDQVVPLLMKAVYPENKPTLKHPVEEEEPLEKHLETEEAHSSENSVKEKPLENISEEEQESSILKSTMHKMKQFFGNKH